MTTTTTGWLRLTRNGPTIMYSFPQSGGASGWIDLSQEDWQGITALVERLDLDTFANLQPNPNCPDDDTNDTAPDWWRQQWAAWNLTAGQSYEIRDCPIPQSVAENI